MYKLVLSLFFVLLVIGAQPSFAYVAEENQGNKVSIEENGDKDLPAEIVFWGPAGKRSIEVTNPSAVFEVMKAIEDADKPDETEVQGDKLGMLELDEHKWMAIYYSEDRNSIILEWEETVKVIERKKFFALFQSEVTAEPLPPGEEKGFLPLPPGEGVHPDDFIPLS